MSHFKKIILLGRPASGKSEFIDFMKRLPLSDRVAQFHIGPISELDDFVWLWEKFVEDDLWEKSGHGRLYSQKDEHGYVVTHAPILDYCLSRFNFEIQKASKEGTVFIEFSRGAGDGGYRYALGKLSDEVLKEAVMLFLYTSYEEACRRNEARFQEKLKHSVLAHRVPEKDMERFGKNIDWMELTHDRSGGFLEVRDLKIPFVTMNNEPELKPDNPQLAVRYQSALDQLTRLYSPLKEKTS